MTETEVGIIFGFQLHFGPRFNGIVVTCCTDVQGARRMNPQHETFNVPVWSQISVQTKPPKPVTSPISLG